MSRLLSAIQLPPFRCCPYRVARQPAVLFHPSDVAEEQRHHFVSVRNSVHDRNASDAGLNYIYKFREFHRHGHGPVNRDHSRE